jgi:hypothetical protein
MGLLGPVAAPTPVAVKLSADRGFVSVHHSGNVPLVMFGFEENGSRRSRYRALAELSGFAGYELVNCLIFHEVTPKGLHYTAEARATSSAVIFGGA